MNKTSNIAQSLPHTVKTIRDSMFLATDLTHQPHLRLANHQVLMAEYNYLIITNLIPLLSIGRRNIVTNLIFRGASF